MKQSGTNLGGFLFIGSEALRLQAVVVETQAVVVETECTLAEYTQHCFSNEQVCHCMYSEDTSTGVTETYPD